MPRSDESVRCRELRPRFNSESRSSLCAPLLPLRPNPQKPRHAATTSSPTSTADCRAAAHASPSIHPIKPNEYDTVTSLAGSSSDNTDIRYHQQQYKYQHEHQWQSDFERNVDLLPPR